MSAQVDVLVPNLKETLTRCQQAPFCLCGEHDCPGTPRNRAKAMVWYARQRNHDAIRLRWSRGAWSTENRSSALSARDRLIRMARELIASDAGESA